MMGNRQLVRYGILDEKTDYRIHVGVEAKIIYIFPTAAGREAVESGRYKMIPVHRQINGEKIQTARGCRVPPVHIEGLRQVPIPDDIIARFPISRADGTSAKGRNAEAIVRAMISENLLLVPMRAVTNIDDPQAQIRGEDIKMTPPSIQVKCDYLAGRILSDGTMDGLFMQTHECNPGKEH